jgi:hypothetical protein
LNRRLDTIEHTHREAEGNIQTLSNHLADVTTRTTSNDVRSRQIEDQMKTDEQTVRDLAGRVALLPSSDDLASVRRDLNDKVCFLYLSCAIGIVRLVVYDVSYHCLRYVTNFNKV